MSTGINKVDVHISEAGYCKQLERLARRKGRFKSIRFPAMFAIFRHPTHGVILFDTGYSEHNFTTMKQWPYKLYQWTTPITLERGQTVKEQLAAQGIQAADVRYIILSHFHADHVGGCRDFPEATFICSERDYDYLRNKTGMAALKEAFIPTLLPDDFATRVRFVEQLPRVTPTLLAPHFTEGYDVFGDGSIIAVFLPGHSLYQFGVLVGEQFFVADACWQHEAYEQLQLPSPLAYLIKANRREYVATIHALHQLHKEKPHVHIIPCHAEVRA